MMPNDNFVTTDKTIRKILLNELCEKYKTSYGTAIIPEFSLPNGLARIDIAVVNGIMHGYELKSDLDNLIRLRSQMHAYNLIFDKVTLVVGKKHILEALRIIPEWWGVTVAKDSNRKMCPMLIPIREASDNPYQDINVIVNLLWKNEASQILEKLGNSKIKYCIKKVVCDSLVASLEVNLLKKYVRKTLLKRSLSSYSQADAKSYTYDD